MFSPNVHPGTFSYTSTHRPLISRGSEIWHGGLGSLAGLPSTPTLSPRQRGDSNRDCQLSILAALQGAEQTSESRQKTVSLIEAMDDQKKLELADFLFAPNGVLPSTLENNACKHFECSSEELDGVLDYDTLEVFLSLWEKVYQQILPNFIAMVYPLEKQDRNLQLRRKFLTFFRDKVLVRVLCNLEHDPRTSQLSSLLFVIDVQTMANSRRYWNFKQLMNKLLGLKPKRFRKTSLLSIADSVSSLPVVRSKVCTTKGLNRQSSEAVLTSGTGTFAHIHVRQTSLNFEEKTRASTISPPSTHKRSVHFNDYVECDSEFIEESVVQV